MTTKIQHRRGTASQWSSANPVLFDGEMGAETDTNRIKCGDGSTAWNSLPYLTLANSEVTSAKIADNAVTADKIAANAVTSAKIADGTIVRADVAADQFADWRTVGNLLTANQASIGSGSLTSDGSISYGSGSATVSGSPTYILLSPAEVAVDAGATYTAHGRLTPTGTAYVGIVWRNSSHADMATSSGNTLSGAGASTVTAVAPAGAAYAVWVVYPTGASVVVSEPGVWRGAGGQWAMPGVPILGLEDGLAKVGNLLTANQASIETDTTGLAGRFYCTAARSTSYADHGSASLVLTATATNGCGGGVAYAAAPAVAAGQTYTAVASVRGVTGARTANVKIMWLNSSRGYISEAATSVVTLTTAFQKLSVTAVAPPAAAFAAVEVHASAGAVSDVIAIDALGLWKGSGGAWAMPGVPITNTGIRPNPANTAEVQIWNDATATWITV